MPIVQYQRFVAYFHFAGWTQISLGVNLSLWPLNFELHVPFGFVRVGMVIDYTIVPAPGGTVYRIGEEESWRTFGYEGARR